MSDDRRLFPIKKTGKAVKAEAIELQLRASRVPAWETEYVFAAALGRKWRFDYAWPAQKVAFEQEGSVFGRSVRGADGKLYRLGGRHNTGAGLQADAEKYNTAAILGWCVIRATTTMIRDGKALAYIVDALKAKGAPLDGSTRTRTVEDAVDAGTARRSDGEAAASQSPA